MKHDTTAPLNPNLGISVYNHVKFIFTESYEAPDCMKNGASDLSVKFLGVGWLLGEAQRS